MSFLPFKKKDVSALHSSSRVEWALADVLCNAVLRQQNAGARIAGTSWVVKYAHQPDQSPSLRFGPCAPYISATRRSTSVNSFSNCFSFGFTCCGRSCSRTSKSLIAWRRSPQIPQVVWIWLQPPRSKVVRGRVSWHARWWLAHRWEPFESWCSKEEMSFTHDACRVRVEDSLLNPLFSSWRPRAKFLLTKPRRSACNLYTEKTQKKSRTSDSH